MNDIADTQSGEFSLPAINSSAQQFTPGQPNELLPGLRRVVAPNGGPMTGPGTNTYILGESARVVIDPGPAIDSHIDSIINESSAPIKFILVTHTHRDHSPAATVLAARCGATLIGIGPPATDWQDQSFRPDRIPENDEVLMLGDVKLRCIYTPGHASNHVCYIHDAYALVFTGDHVMQGSTVVIPPEDGSMSDYIASLRRLEAEALQYIAPGHGKLITNPARVLARLVRHRLHREAKVLGALKRAGEVTLDELLALVYNDVSDNLLPVAVFSLRSHLIKLEAEGLVSGSDAGWSIV